MFVVWEEDQVPGCKDRYNPIMLFIISGVVEGVCPTYLQHARSHPIQAQSPQESLERRSDHQSWEIISTSTREDQDDDEVHLPGGCVPVGNSR